MRQTIFPIKVSKAAYFTQLKLTELRQGPHFDDVLVELVIVRYGKHDLIELFELLDVVDCDVAEFSSHS